MRTFKRFAVLTLVFTLCVLPTLIAEEKLALPGVKAAPSQASTPAIRTYPWDTGNVSTIRARLAAKGPEINFDGVEFEQCIGFLRDLTSLNIVVNWSALETAAIEKDMEVSFVAKDASMHDILQLLLDNAGAGEVDLAYEIRNNSVCISTREDLNCRTFVHIYSVRDLLDAAAGTSVEIDERQIHLARLMTLIQASVEPESWRAAGGNVGAICDFSELLIVTQTQTAHQQIWDLLENIRSALRHSR